MNRFFSPELPSLKLTAKAPENGWLEDDPFLLGFGNFSGAFAVSFRECTSFCSTSLPNTSNKSSWWFQIFFIFTPWGNNPI